MVRLRYEASQEQRRHAFGRLFSCREPCETHRHVQIGAVRPVTLLQANWSMTEVPVTLAWSLVPPPPHLASQASAGRDTAGSGARQLVQLSVLRSVLSPEEVARIAALLPADFDLDRADVEMIPKRWIVVQRGSRPQEGREPLAAAMRPALEERILPFVRRQLRCPGCAVCSSIVRRYAHALGERHRDPPHTDGQAFATVVVALNSAGVDFEGGLYVVTDPARPLVVGMRAGDAVVHRWDLQHGVEVSRGRRLSWILWLQDREPCVAQEELHRRPFLREAADAGNVVAMHILGSGASGLTPEGQRWMLRSAQAGFVKAMTQLGTLLQSSDLRAAQDWLAVAAEQGDVAAQAQLGLLLLNHKGDLSSAERWLRLAARGGHTMAQNELAMALFVGRLGRKPEVREAVRLLAAAARQGHAMAQTNLGFCYAEGRGVEKSVRAAYYWWREAASQDRPEALENLQRLQEANPSLRDWPDISADTLPELA